MYDGVDAGKAPVASADTNSKRVTRGSACVCVLRRST